MSDEERLTIAAMVRAYRTFPPYDIEGQLKHMNKILETIDAMVQERLLAPNH